MLNYMNQFLSLWHQAKHSLGKHTVYIFSTLVLLRIISLGLYPLMDTTEGRYGEISRKMAEMNDWVTPWFDVGVPFWGKPPLSFWMSALGIKLFGINEFAVRIPHFLAALLVVAICYDWAKRSRINPFYATVLLSTSFLFFIASGAVMTDMALCVGSTLSLRAFWLSLRGSKADQKREQWLFFIGLSIMLLAKGPVGWALVLLPIGLWTLISGSIKETWQGLAWVTGCLLAILVAVPWYLIAEQHTPGFLHYFFIGEHWQRFTVSGWKGDLYGTAHAMPRGTIWLHLIYGSLPWSLILPVAGWLYKRQPAIKNDTNQQQLSLYLLMAGLAPCLFFTMSGNIIWTYVLPGLPALALYLALWLGRINQVFAKKVVLIGTTVSTIILLGVLSTLTVDTAADLKSAKSIVRLYAAQKSTQPLIFLADRPYSAMFYSHGTALKISSIEEINRLEIGKPTYIAVRKELLLPLNEPLKGLKIIGDAGNYRLYLMN